MPRYDKILNYLLMVALCCFTLVPATTLVWYLQSDKGILLENGSVLGGDFIAFYTGGKCFLENPNRTYDTAFQNSVRDQIFSETGESYHRVLPFVYPPVFPSLPNFPS